jgi:hypothetical protein
MVIKFTGGLFTCLALILSWLVLLILLRLLVSLLLNWFGMQRSLIPAK